MSLFFGSLKRISFSGKIILPVNCRPGFWSHSPAFPLATVKIVLPHPRPPTNSLGVSCSPPRLCAQAPGPSSRPGFAGGTWPHVNHTVCSSDKHQSVINVLMLTAVRMRSWRGQGRNEQGALSPLSSLKGCTCSMDKEQLLLPELSKSAPPVLK